MEKKMYRNIAVVSDGTVTTDIVHDGEENIVNTLKDLEATLPEGEGLDWEKGTIYMDAQMDIAIPRRSVVFLQTLELEKVRLEENTQQINKDNSGKKVFDLPTDN